MSVVDKAAIEASYVPNTETTAYTVAAGVRGTILKYTVTNVSASSATITVKLVASGGSAATANTIVPGKSVAPGETYNCPELVGHTLNAGDFISELAGTASALVRRATIREVS